MKHNIHAVFRNVEINPLKRADIELLRNWRNDPVNTLYLNKIGYISCEQQIKWFENYLINEDEIFFTIKENCDLRRTVGSAALYNWKQDEVEFGKILIGDDEAHGRRIGYKTLIMMLFIAFSLYNKDRVVLYCFAENNPALCLYNKVGFMVTKEIKCDDGKINYFMTLDRSYFYNRYKDELLEIDIYE